MIATEPRRKAKADKPAFATMKPTADWVLVRMEIIQETAGGIQIPDTAKMMDTREKFCEGQVVSVGPGRLLSSGDLHPVQPRPGDAVLFDRRGADILGVEGVYIWLVMREQYVTGIL